MRSHTVDLGHFEQLYEKSADPWHFATSPYEQAKYAATLAALPRPRYGRGLDVGCSIGVLTEGLAARCDSLLAIEPVEAALAQARQRNASRPWVRFAPFFVPRDWPDEPFDLIVISEVLDYLGSDDLFGLADRVRGSLAPEGDLILVHWVGKKGPVASETEASEAVIRALKDILDIQQAERTADYRLDVLHRKG